MRWGPLKCLSKRKMVWAGGECETDRYARVSGSRLMRLCLTFVVLALLFRSKELVSKYIVNFISVLYAQYLI